MHNFCKKQQHLNNLYGVFFVELSDVVILLQKIVLHSQQYWLIFESWRVCFYACLICSHTVLIELFVFSLLSCPFRIVILSGPAGYYLDHWQRLGQKKFCFWLYSIKAEAIHTSCDRLHQHDMKCVRWHSKCLKAPGFWLDIYTST